MNERKVFSFHDALRSLAKWRRAWVPTHTRTLGEILFNKNGSCVDIWIRVNGELRWFGVDQAALSQFLRERVEPPFSQEWMVLVASSDGNAEEQKEHLDAIT